MVAFSGFAMANNLEVKEKVVLVTDCSTIATTQTNESEASSGGCYTSSQWQKIYTMNYDRCNQEKRISEA